MDIFLYYLFHMVTPKTIPRKRLIIAVGLTAFLLTLAGTSYYMFNSRSTILSKFTLAPISKMALKGVSENSASKTIGSQANQMAVSATPTFSLPTKSGENNYISQNKRLGFYFSQSSGGNSFATKESGNTITVYEKDNPKISQDLEVFSKNPSATIQEAITSSVLNGYTSSSCPISITTANFGLPSNIETASINYSSDNQLKGGFGIADRSKCPIQYTVAFDNKYFLVDKNHPNKLLFFRLGQFSIPAGQAQSWQDTISQF